MSASPFFARAFGGISQGSDRVQRVVTAEGNPERKPRDYAALKMQREVRSRQALCTPRQLRIWELVALGYSRAEIAKHLGLHVKSFDADLAHLKERVVARNSADLTRAAIAIGLICVPVSKGKART